MAQGPSGIAGLPYVDLVVECDRCANAVVTDTHDLVRMSETIPLSLDQARAWADTRMHGWCHEDVPMILVGFTVYAPDDASDDPLLEWDETDNA